MPGLWTITPRSDGEILTHTKYNADRQEVVDNAIPSQIDDYSATVPQMQAATNPGAVGTESQASSLAGEIERLRYAIADAKGTTHWYESTSTSKTDGIALGIWS